MLVWIYIFVWEIRWFFRGDRQAESCFLNRLTLKHTNTQIYHHPPQIHTFRFSISISHPSVEFLSKVKQRTIKRHILIKTTNLSPSPFVSRYACLLYAIKRNEYFAKHLIQNVPCKTILINEHRGEKNIRTIQVYRFPQDYTHIHIRTAQILQKVTRNDVNSKWENV